MGEPDIEEDMPEYMLDAGEAALKGLGTGVEQPLPTGVAAVSALAGEPVHVVTPIPQRAHEPRSQSHKSPQRECKA